MFTPNLLSALLFTALQWPQDSLKSTQINEVVVTTSSPTTLSPLPLSAVAVSVVDSAQLARSGHSHLLSAIQGQVPSLFVSERNILGFGVSTGGAGGIKMRGVGGEPTSGVLVMVDGQPQYTGIFGHHTADLYKTDNVERVEVMRGAASASYGSNAMGGVVNIITREAKVEGLHGSLSSQLGSFATWQGTLGGSYRKKDFSASTSFSYDRTDGAQPGFDFRQGSISSRLDYRLKRGWQLGASLQLAKFLADDPVYPREYMGVEGVYHQNVARGSVTLGAQRRHPTASGTMSLYYSWGNHYIQDPKPFHSLDSRAGFTALQHFEPWRTATAAVGLDLDTYQGRVPLSGGMNMEQAPRATMALQRITECQPHLHLTQTILPGLMHLSGALRMAWSDKFGTHWVPQASLSLGPRWLCGLRASVARGFRNPTFKELHLYAMANPTLKPEQLTTYELSLTTRLPQLLTLEVTGYWINGSRTITLSEGKWANTRDFDNRGVELMMNLHLAPWMQFNANYSYLHTSLQRLTAAPKHQFFAEALCTPHRKWQLSARLRSVGALYVDDTMPSHSFTTLSLRAQYRPNRHLMLHLMADNITNTHYVILRGYTMPGLTLQGGFRLEY